MATLQSTRVRWDDMPRERLSDKLERRYVSGEHITLAQFHLAKGCVVPSHTHANEQFAHVISGCVRFLTGADGRDVVDVRGGEVLMIPPGLPHSAEALEDSLVIDAFSPVRTDWLEQRDTYLRG